MLRVVIILVIIVLMIYSLVEVAQANRYQVRLFPRWLWVFAVVCLPIVGPLSWLFFGRPTAGGNNQGPVTGPDDDDDFLRGLS